MKVFAAGRMSEDTTTRYSNTSAATVNQAYMITGLVEQQFSTVTLTVRTLRLLNTTEIQAPSEALEELNA